MRIGWRAVTVFTVFLCLMWVGYFLALVADGVSTGAAALDACLIIGAAVAITSAVCGAAIWASKDSDK